MPWPSRILARSPRNLGPLTRAADDMMEPSVEQDPGKTAALVALAKAVAGEGPGDEVPRFSILGTALCWQYKHNADVDVLRRAGDAYRVAVGAVPRADPFGDTLLSTLAASSPSCTGTMATWRRSRRRSASAPSA